MTSIDALPNTTFSGRRFTRKQLAQVQQTVQTFFKLSRKELAETICEHLQWKNPRGANKIASSLKLLEALEAHGVVTLPKKRVVKRSPRHGVKNIELAESGPPIAETLEAISPIVFERVVLPEQRAAFKASVHVHHYLGYKHPVGAQIAYFIVSQPRAQRLGCLLFSASAAFHLAPRDQWIGWEKKHRVKLLHLILSQDRFVIFPWVEVPHLASHVLSMANKSVVDDWVKVHGYRPALVETFVDTTRFSGTCYQAANWLHVGQTQGRGRFDPKHQYAETIKDIYLMPLVKDCRRVLTSNHQSRALNQRYRNDVKLSHQRNVDEGFVALWQKVVHLIETIAARYDAMWRVRKRTISTLMLILLIFRLVLSKNKQSYATTIDELWDSCKALDIPLPQPESIVPSSLCEARKKLDERIFMEINREILLAYSDADALEHRFFGHRLFAVDGSKVHLPRSLRTAGYHPPGEHAAYPQGLLSTLYQLKPRLPIDFDLVAHGNERLCAEAHLEALTRDDIVVYDRGYFSYILLHRHCEAQIHAVFRLQPEFGGVIKSFIDGANTDTVVTLYPSDGTLSDIKKQRPELSIVPRTMRLLKYTINETTFCLGTTLVDPAHLGYPLQAFMDLYHARWGVEELYKISKRLIDVEDFHAKSERGVKQELFAHFVLITLNRLLANEADDMHGEPVDTGPLIDDPLRSLLEPPRDLPALVQPSKRQTNFKNCLAVVTRHLEPLLLLHDRLSATLQKAYRKIARCFQRVRPGRCYPRKSMRPGSKWHPSDNKPKKKKSKKGKITPIPTVQPAAAPV